MTRRSAAGVLVLLFVSVLAVALPVAAATPSTVMVTIPSGAGAGQSSAPGYSPATIKVVIGVNNTVVWTNDDTAHHTVMSVTGNGSISSGDIAPAASFNYTFTAAGTYHYHCNYHTWMAGAVTVLASTAPAPEFPVAWLAVILFAVIAAAAVAVPRLRPTHPAVPAAA